MILLVFFIGLTVGIHAGLFLALLLQPRLDHLIVVITTTDERANRRICDTFMQAQMLRHGLVGPEGTPLRN